MFTGLVTIATLYLTIGVGIKIAKDDTGKVAEQAIELIKGSASWPKEIYEKLKKD
jgi:hypothetical protein